MLTRVTLPSYTYHYAATEFGNIAYRETGKGAPAIFVHGVFLNGHLWDRVIEHLGDVRRCIAVDLLAHGKTAARADQNLSFEAQADMLVAFCNAMGLDRVDVVANDSGSAIAQIFAARHPERIESLTLTNGDIHDNWPPKQAEPLIKLAKEGGLGPVGQRMLSDLAFARANFASGFEHPDWLLPEDFKIWLEPLFESQQSTRNLERFIASFDNRQTVEIEPLLRKLQAPTLIVWGTGDTFFSTDWALWLRDTIPGVREVVELRDAKLFFPLERPDELAAALRKFWREQPSR